MARYRVTNTGNGSETFRLVMNSVLAGDQFDPVPSATPIYFDSDTTPGLRPATRRTWSEANDPVLSADGFVIVLSSTTFPRASSTPTRRHAIDGRLAYRHRRCGHHVCGPGQRNQRRGRCGRRHHGRRRGSRHQLQRHGREPDGQQDSGRRRSVRRHAAGARRAHQLLGRSQRGRLGNRDQRGVHRQHPGEHDLRAGNAALNAAVLSDGADARRRRLHGDSTCERARPARFTHHGRADRRRSRSP